MSAEEDCQISRREWMHRAFGFGAAACAAGCAAPPAGEIKRPNVLFVAVDDLNDWIGVLGGHPQAKTPNIDRLARSGVVFQRAYCQAPSCNPSRTSVLSGLRPTTSGVYGNGDLWREALPDAVTLPQYFLQHGYETLGGGKVFHGPQNDAASWERYFNIPGFLHPPQQPASGIPGVGHFDWSSLDADDSETADGQVAAWASDYLQAEHERPFFCAVGFYRPHLSWYAPKKYFDQFSEDSTILPPFLEGDVDDVPPSAVRQFRDHARVTAAGQWKRAVAAYLSCIRFADENVGRLLRALDEGPNAENTIVVLWTDHGWQLGEKKHWRKFTLWERVCRVALTIRAPGVTQPGGTCERVVELVDLYPTLADLCGLPPKPELDGESLRPLLEDPQAPWDKPAITSNGSDKTSVRTERMRYSRFPDGEELYDHDNDPNEWENLAERPEHAATKERLAALLPTEVALDPVPQWNKLNAEQQNLAPVPAGRFRASDAPNDIGLSSDWRTLAE